MRRLILVALLAGAVVTTAAAAVLIADDGRIGPDRRLTPSGRQLSPFGKLVRIGQFPTGGALTPNGRYYWTLSTGRGQNDIRIVSIRSSRVLQTIRMPGLSGGIAMDPTKPLAYVSGVSDSHHADQKSPAGTPGIEGDTIHVFSYSRKTGSAKFERLLDVPPPSSATAPQTFPPTNLSERTAWPDRLAISPDGKRLLVPLNLGDAAAIVDIASKAVRYVETGNYPYGAAILRDGKRGLVSNETPGTVSVIDLDAGTRLADIQVGPHLSHPGSITLDPKADRAYVPLANSDQVVVIDTKTFKVTRTLSVERPEGLGASPVDTAVTPDGSKLLVANAGTDEIVVFALPGAGAEHRSAARRAAERILAREARLAAERAGESETEEEEEEGEARAAAVRRAPLAYSLIGRIPTAQYPSDVAVAPAKANPCGTRKGKRRKKGAKRCSKLLYISAKGLGVGPNPKGPQPDSPLDNDSHINETQYLPLLNVGTATVADFPTTKRLAKLSRFAEKQIRPTNSQKAPAGTPLRPGGPIKHVFYIVRENRTYDQILGDDSRGDGDPKLALFGQGITPNVHALVRNYPLLDHVYANSEASIDGHYWTAAASVSDYVHKNWFQNYGGRGRPYDFGAYMVSSPPNGFLFDQAERQGISYFNFGEAVANVFPGFPDKDRTRAEQQAEIAKFLRSDIGIAGSAPLVNCYPNDISVGYDAVVGAATGTANAPPVFDSMPPPGARADAQSRYRCFETKFTGMLQTGTVPTFTYMVLPNDHTRVLSAGAISPRAMIADNDEGLGRIVDLISHSSIWKQSAIFVIEDDSQDGADHVDAHRMPALVISPFAKRGAVIHTRYDMLSVIRSMELIMGMRPLGLFDALGVPMYDVFEPDPTNDTPYDYIPAKVDLMERNPEGTPGARESSRLPRCLDCAAQRDLDRLLWKSVHGWDAEPPPPGPNAEGIDEVRLGGG